MMFAILAQHTEKSIDRYSYGPQANIKLLSKNRRSSANTTFMSDTTLHQEKQEQDSSLLNPRSAFDSVEHADFLFNWD